MLTVTTTDGVDEDGVPPVELKARPLRAARPFARKALALLGLAAVFVGVLLVRNWRADSDSDSATERAPSAAAPAMPSNPAIEEKYGVRFLGVDITSAGGMIQVRYQVLDSDKTQAIHSQEATPAVIDSAGVVYNLPGMAGHTHIGPVKKAGTTEFVLLANARGGVKAGSTVTLKIGELELHDVPVD